jgi:osmoprotectant transport system permease protein
LGAALAIRLAFAGAAVVALAVLPTLSVAPNRLLPGRPVAAADALGIWHFGAAALVIGAELLSRSAADSARRMAPVLTLAALLGMLAVAGRAAEAALAGHPPSARAALGAGFWLGGAALLALAWEQARFAVPRSGPFLVSAVLFLGLAALVTAGFLDHLSLVVEARARSQALQAAILEHLVLSAGALALALAGTLPVAALSLAAPRPAAAAQTALSIVQIIPAVALFALLLPLIAALLVQMPILRQIGIRAIGPAPALIGVAAYCALPLLRGLVGGLHSPDPAVLESGRAMGFSRWRLLVAVRLPLGWPVLASALRVAAVQSIGLVTLGGLIGAGGLGALVFEGMAQFATDLILLGALPIVVLALVADAILGLALPRSGAWR